MMKRQVAFFCGEDLNYAHPACLLAGSFEHMTSNAIGEASKQKACNFLV
jgi:hypothetical protein